VVSPKLRKLAAIPVGLTFAGALAAAMYSWLGHYIEQQGIQELDIAARRVIALTERRLARVSEALDELAARGVRTCAGGDLGAMHEASFRVVPIKELSIVAPDGETRCTNLSISLGQRRVMSAPIENPRSDLVIEVIRLSDRNDSMVRVRRVSADGSALAALVPSDLLMPRISPDGGPLTVTATLAAGDGTVIGERTAQRAEGDDDESPLVARFRSERFGIVVTASIARSRVLGNQRGLVLTATAATGASATLILALTAFGAFRRRSDDPVAELKRAMRNNEFVAYYQPIVDLATAKVVGAEVLIRWRKPGGDLVPPVKFIPLAETSGLIVELTRVLMRRVCEEAGAALGSRTHFNIGFNLSAQHFRDEAIVDDVRAIFSASPVSLEQVVLEVTERQPLDNLTMARRAIAALQGLGVHVGIDDLGTGHSGLSYMLKLGVDFIKLDKMFVDAIDSERYSTTIIETLVALARDMRMDIIAEGVETFEQVQHLRERGIRKAQGYVFAPPLPGPAFLQLLEAADPIRSAAPVAKVA
jgi:sensor c-di-GMP phosphodiesterase-like protein